MMPQNSKKNVEGICSFHEFAGISMNNYLLCLKKLNL